MRERKRDSHCAVAPDSVRAMIARTPMRFDSAMAAMAMAWSVRWISGGVTMFDSIGSNWRSAASQMLRMAATALLGCLPEAVSAESITASLPSITALATSSTSARVGIGESTMDCNICVAVITTR